MLHIAPKKSTDLQSVVIVTEEWGWWQIRVTPFLTPDADGCALEALKLTNWDFKALALACFQEVQGSFPVVLRSASDGLEVVLCELSCPPGRNLWVAIRAVGCGTHVAVLGHGAAV
eukprot:scaffold45596_cov58-Attheya_sp.AAC.7